MSSTVIFSYSNENQNLVLAKDYINDHLMSDETTIWNLLKIRAQLEAYLIKDNTLYLQDGYTKVSLPIPLYVKNRFGEMVEEEIVKMLKYHEHSYEIRLNYDFESPRIIFCLCTSLASHVMTYGFSKNRTHKRFNSGSDQTDEAAIETDKIHHEINTLKKRKKWLGEGFE